MSLANLLIYLKSSTRRDSDTHRATVPMSLRPANVSCTSSSATLSLLVVGLDFFDGFEVVRSSVFARPNVEVTGSRRHGTLAARSMMGRERIAARVPCRSESG